MKDNKVLLDLAEVSEEQKTDAHALDSKYLEAMDNFGDIEKYDKLNAEYLEAQNIYRAKWN